MDVYGYLNTVDGTKYIYDMSSNSPMTKSNFDNNQIKGTEWKFSISDINIKRFGCYSLLLDTRT